MTKANNTCTRRLPAVLLALGMLLALLAAFPLPVQAAAVVYLDATAAAADTYNTLQAALDNVDDGGQIVVTSDIVENARVYLQAARKATLVTGGFTVTLTDGLTVREGTLLLDDSAGGSLDVNMARASSTALMVYSGGRAQVSSATNTSEYGCAVDVGLGGTAEVRGDAVAAAVGGIGAAADTGGRVEVGGEARGGLYGAYAKEAGSVITAASATSDDGTGAAAAAGGYVEITGAATGVKYGAYAVGAGSKVQAGSATGAGSEGATAKAGGYVEIAGAATGVGFGAVATGTGSVTMAGSAVATGAEAGKGAGAVAFGGGRVKVRGDAEGMNYGAFAQSGSRVEVGGEACGRAYGAYAGDAGSVVTAGSATATAESGAGAAAWSGGRAEVAGAATGGRYGIRVVKTDSVVTAGSATATGENGFGVLAEAGGYAEVKGDVNCATGALAFKGTIYIHGNINATQTGVLLVDQTPRADDDPVGLVTVDGTITAPVYVQLVEEDAATGDELQQRSFAAGEGAAGSGEDEGYLVYSDGGIIPGRVRVRIPVVEDSPQTTAATGSPQTGDAANTPLWAATALLALAAAGVVLRLRGKARQR